MIYFTSDLHFNHKFMAGRRKFGTPENPDVEKMNEAIITAWNTYVTRKDEVYVIGDFAFGPQDKAKKIFYRLNGHKHLIKGNHDAKWMDDWDWASVSQIKVVKWDGQYKAQLCHYPMMTWWNAHKGMWHLHGHTHGNLPKDNNTRIDVGPDATGMVVVSSDWVVEQMSTREYDYVDHHRDGDFEY